MGSPCPIPISDSYPPLLMSKTTWIKQIQLTSVNSEFAMSQRFVKFQYNELWVVLVISCITYSGHIGIIINFHPNSKNFKWNSTRKVYKCIMPNPSIGHWGYTNIVVLIHCKAITRVATAIQVWAQNRSRVMQYSWQSPLFTLI